MLCFIIHFYFTSFAGTDHMESLSTSNTNSSTNNSAVKIGPSSSYIEVLKKTKKNEPKIVPQLVLVDKEAFGSEGGDNGSTVRTIWKS